MYKTKYNKKNLEIFLYIHAVTYFRYLYNKNIKKFQNVFVIQDKYNVDVCYVKHTKYEYIKKLKILFNFTILYRNFKS